MEYPRATHDLFRNRIKNQARAGRPGGFFGAGVTRLIADVFPQLQDRGRGLSEGERMLTERSIVRDVPAHEGGAFP